MLQSPSLPHLFSSEVWLPVLTFVFGGSISAIKLWLARKKPSEIKASNARTLAEARKHDADATAVISQIVVQMSANLAEANNELEAQRERFNAEIEKQRTRTHNAISEVNRCVGYLKRHEILMTKKELEFEPFTVKTYTDIVGDDE